MHCTKMKRNNSFNIIIALQTRMGFAYLWNTHFKQLKSNFQLLAENTHPHEDKLVLHKIVDQFMSNNYPKMMEFRFGRDPQAGPAYKLNQSFSNHYEKNEIPLCKYECAHSKLNNG